MMTRRNLDIEASTIVIECLKKRRRAVYRAVPVPATLLRTMDRWARQQNAGEGGRLWPWSRMTAYRRVTEIMREADIVGPWATPKGLRHGFGVRAVLSGVPLHLVQRWLGHADMKTTAIYAGAVGPEERAIAARIWVNDSWDSASRHTRPREGVDESFDDNFGTESMADAMSKNQCVRKTNGKPLVARLIQALTSINT